MGWWSTSPLGGDEPLDALSELEDLLKVNELYPLEAIDDVTRKKVKRNWKWSKIANWLCGKSDNNGMYHISPVNAQVVVCLGMACGIKFTDFHKSEFIKLIDEDPWGQQDKERKLSMDALKEALLNYENGVPTFIDNPGVLETMLSNID